MPKTKADLKAEMDAAGIKYDASATKAELEDILVHSVEQEDIQEDALEVEQEPSVDCEPVVMTAKCLVNVRTSPDAGDNVARRINAGTEVVIVSSTGAWSQTDDGMFIMTEYLR